LFKTRENHMQPKPIKEQQDQLFKSRLSEQLKPNHELLKLAKKIPWEQLEAEFKPLFSEGPSRPPLPVRLVVGLMMLQHMFNESDENVVKSWVENPYWQHFCGYDFLQWELPIHPTSLTGWRKRLGPEGMEKILQASIQVAVETQVVSPQELSKAICDTTVMPKAVTYPTDAKLIYRSLERIVRAALRAKLHLKRTYRHVARWALREYQRLMHGKRVRKAQRPLGQLKRYLTKVLRDLDPYLENCPRELLREAAIGAKLLLQTREDKHKIYSCHEPQVACIAKGKAHKPYEFGSKACLVISEKRGVALSMITYPGNPYDGHLLEEAKHRAEKNTQIIIERMLVDRGFRGHGVKGAEVLISYTKGLTKHLKRVLRRRQAIEPWIGHMKQEGQLSRCHLKGFIGDQMHALLVAVGHNFRLILRKLRLFYAFLWSWVTRLLSLNEQKMGGLSIAC
jgi:transposase, IS5 family